MQMLGKITRENNGSLIIDIYIYSLMKRINILGNTKW